MPKRKHSEDIQLRVMSKKTSEDIDKRSCIIPESQPCKRKYSKRITDESAEERRLRIQKAKFIKEAKFNGMTDEEKVFFKEEKKQYHADYAKRMRASWTNEQRLKNNAYKSKRNKISMQHPHLYSKQLLRKYLNRHKEDVKSQKTLDHIVALELKISQTKPDYDRQKKEEKEKLDKYVKEQSKHVKIDKRCTLQLKDTDQELTDDILPINFISPLFLDQNREKTLQQYKEQLQSKKPKKQLKPKEKCISNDLQTIAINSIILEEQSKEQFKEPSISNDLHLIQYPDCYSKLNIMDILNCIHRFEFDHKFGDDTFINPNFSKESIILTGLTFSESLTIEQIKFLISCPKNLTKEQIADVLNFSIEQVLEPLTFQSITNILDFVSFENMSNIIELLNTTYSSIIPKSLNTSESVETNGMSETTIEIPELQTSEKMNEDS